MQFLSRSITSFLVLALISVANVRFDFAIDEPN
jgi:hypothetical protein